MIAKVALFAETNSCFYKCLRQQDRFSYDHDGHAKAVSQIVDSTGSKDMS